VCPATDQRGVARPQPAGGQCDIGAFEYGAIPATITLDAPTLSQTYEGGPHVVTATTVPAGLSYAVTYKGLAPAPTDAGPYFVVATITAPGYTAPDATGTLTIDRAASCVVTTLADSGAGSLRALLPNCAAITFQAGLTGTITLVSDLPTVTQTVSVAGPGAASLTIDRNNQSGTATAFPVGAGGTLALEGLTVKRAGNGVYLPTATSSATVTNSTLSGNTVGMELDGSSTATVTTSTLSGNTTASLLFQYVNTVSLANTLLAQASGHNCTFSPGGTAITPDHSLADDPSCFAGGSNGNQVVAAGAAGLDLNGLQTNGGPTPTIALRPTSPAINAGDTTTCQAPPVSAVDQRGQPRVPGACDVGAYEYPGPAAQTINFAPLGDKTYGDQSFTVSATASSGLLVSLAPSGNCSVSGATVTLTGAGSCTITASQDGSANYLAAPPVQRQFSIAQATLTVTPNPQNPSRVYGTANPAIAASYSGFVGTDGTGTLTTAPTCSTTANGTSGVDPYPITCGGGAAANYTFAYVAGTLTITPASQVIAFTSTAPTGAAYGASYSVTATGGASGNPVTFSSLTPGVCTVVGGTVGFVGTGTCTIAANQAGSSNYLAAQQVTQQFSVAGATLMVTADNKTKVLNAPNPPLTYTITGFINNDTVAVVSGSPALSTTATTTSGVGTYPISVTQGTLSAANYRLQFVNATLSVQYASGGTCNGAAGHAILQPVNADGSSVFKQGSTVPIKFRVCDANGVSVGTAGVVVSFQLYATQAAATPTVNEVVDATTPDAAFRWDPTAQQWIFNLSTKALANNTKYFYRIKLNDGTVIEFSFGLK
jgi:hypothetical protein